MQQVGRFAVGGNAPIIIIVVVETVPDYIIFYNNLKVRSVLTMHYVGNIVCYIIYYTTLFNVLGNIVIVL